MSIENALIGLYPYAPLVAVMWLMLHGPKAVQDLLHIPLVSNICNAYYWTLFTNICNVLPTEAGQLILASHMSPWDTCL